MIYKITYRDVRHTSGGEVIRDEKKYLYVLEDQIHSFIKERPFEDKPEIDVMVWFDSSKQSGESTFSTTTSYIEKIESV